MTRNPQKNTAPVVNHCIHEPRTTKERNQNPLDCWCDECQEACCVGCFEINHKNKGHKWQGSDQTKLINKIRLNPISNKSKIKDVKSKKHREFLEKELEKKEKSNK